MKCTSFALELEDFFPLTSLLHYTSSMSFFFMLHTKGTETGVQFHVPASPPRPFDSKVSISAIFVCDLLALKLISSFLIFQFFQ